MRIGFDARFAVGKERGIGVHSINLLRNLAQIDTENTYFLYTDKPDINNVLPKQDNFIIRKIGPSFYPIWEHISLPLAIKKDNLDVLHCPGNTGPIVPLGKVKLLVTIHDIMFLKSKDEIPSPVIMYQKLGKLYRSIVSAFILKKGFDIIAISEYSKKDILDYLGVNKSDKIHVIYNGFDAVSFRNSVIDESEISFQVPKEYILALGALDPRKNTKLIVQAYTELRKENKISCPLILSGFPEWESSSVAQDIKNNPFRDDIVLPGFISRQELITLYSKAKVFLYPSLYEGFGFPILESMAFGVPTITSNVTSMPEIAGDAAILVDPKSKKSIKDAISETVNDKNLCEMLKDKGKSRVKFFSWATVAEQTLSMYKSLN